VLPAGKEQLDNKEQQVLKVFRELQLLWVLLVLLVLLDKDFKEQLVLLDHREQQVLKVFRELRPLWVLLVLLVLLVRQGPLEKEQQAQQVKPAFLLQLML
jgi:hypothetical protein